MNLKKILLAGAAVGIMTLTGCAGNTPGNNNGNRNGERLSERLNRSIDSNYSNGLDGSYNRSYNNNYYDGDAFDSTIDRSYRTNSNSLWGASSSPTPAGGRATYRGPIKRSPSLSGTATPRANRSARKIK
ncbi:MAG: hypothetical protein LBU32_25880 [Clostridiales bacterium]|jgi:hypothetical protein|nr:hypothetical protein [Clostridiales bacterium]